MDLMYVCMYVKTRKVRTNKYIRKMDDPSLCKNKKRKNKINIHKEELDPEAGKGNATHSIESCKPLGGGETLTHQKPASSSGY